MPQKIKAKINAIFVQLNRFSRQRKDFSAQVFVKSLDSFFQELDQIDISGDRGLQIDEQLKLRINTVPRKAEPLLLAIPDLMVLYFWYLRRPGNRCSSSLIAAKKLRGQPDDSEFLVGTLAPLIFQRKLKGFGKQEKHLREVLLTRAALVLDSFREGDTVQPSATRVMGTDTWQKKMLHIAALHRKGRGDAIRSVAPREELKQIAGQNDFARKYLEENKIYVLPNRFLLMLKRVFGNAFSVLLSPFNMRLVIHIFRNRLPVYLVYLVLVAAFIFGAYKMKDLWQLAHDSHLEAVEQEYPRGGQE